MSAENNDDDEALFDDKDLIEEEINKKIGDDNKAKELFSNKHITTRTEVSDREISLISRLAYFSESFKIPEINKMLNKYMELKLSHKRKSRKEYLEASKYNESLEKLFNGGGGGGGFGFHR